MSGRQPLRFWFLLCAICCFAIVGIGIRGQLGMYVHPRYHFFTLLSALIGGAILTRAAFLYRYKGTTELEYDSPVQLVMIFGKWLLGRGGWLVITLALLLIWSPAKPLLSRAAEQKDKEVSVVDDYVYKAPWYSNPTTVFQLSTVLSTENGYDTLKDKEFELVGFVRASKTYNSDIFRLSRFVVSCCAVDATPNSINVQLPDWEGKVTVDQWVLIKGRLSTVELGSSSVPALIDVSFEPAIKPADPYDFMSY